MKKDPLFYHADFLFEILDHLPDALVLLDSSMKIKLSNRLFKEMFVSGPNLDFDEILGQTIRCKDFFNEQYSHSLNVNCSHCKLLQSVRKSISTKSQQAQEMIVLQTLKDKKDTLRLIQFQATYIQFENQDFVLLKLNDYTHLGNETANLIAEFGKKR